MAGSVKQELRVGAKPPAKVQRVMIALEVLHCIKIQAASRFFECLDRAMIEPPWWAALGFSSKPQSLGERNDAGVRGFAGSQRPRTLELSASRPGKCSLQPCTSAT